MYLAVVKQNVVLVDLLLTYGADVRLSGKYKKTPLMCAVSDVSTENQSEKRQYDYLHPAKKQIKLMIIQLLIRAGADPNEKVEGFPLSAYEIATQRVDRQVVDLLEAYGGHNI